MHDSTTPPAPQFLGDVSQLSGSLTKRGCNALTPPSVNAHNYGTLDSTEADDVAGMVAGATDFRDVPRSFTADFEALARVEQLERKVKPSVLDASVRAIVISRSS